MILPRLSLLALALAGCASAPVTTYRLGDVTVRVAPQAEVEREWRERGGRCCTAVLGFASRSERYIAVRAVDADGTPDYAVLGHELHHLMTGAANGDRDVDMDRLAARLDAGVRP